MFWTEWSALCKGGPDGIHEQVGAPVASGSCPPRGHQLRAQASSSMMQNCSCRASTSLLKVAQGWLPPRYKSPSNHSPNWPLKRRGKAWYGSLLGAEIFQVHTIGPWPHHDRSPVLPAFHLPLNRFILNCRGHHTLSPTGFRVLIFYSSAILITIYSGATLTTIQF